MLSYQCHFQAMNQNAFYLSAVAQVVDLLAKIDDVTLLFPLLERFCLMMALAEENFVQSVSYLTNPIYV